MKSDTDETVTTDLPPVPQGRLAKAIRNPGAALKALRLLLKGRWFLLSCRLRGLNVEGGQGLKIQGKFVMRGPGKLVLGKNVHVSMRVTPYTHSGEAVIDIGDNTFLNGTRFGCAESIVIGKNCLIGDARIMDTDFHSIYANRWDADAPIRVKPIKIGENVWIGANTGILPGTRIGMNSVVAYGSVCAGRYRKNAIILGNPARAETSIPELKTPDKSEDQASDT